MIVYYRYNGEVEQGPELPDHADMFRTGRKAKGQRIERPGSVLLCDSNATAATRAGYTYFVPREKRRKKSKYHRIIDSADSLERLHRKVMQ